MSRDKELLVAHSIDWQADGHDVRICGDWKAIRVSANGGFIDLSQEDANALLALLEAFENGGME